MNEICFLFLSCPSLTTGYICYKHHVSRKVASSPAANVEHAVAGHLDKSPDTTNMMQTVCLNLQASTKLSTAASLPVVTAVQKLAGFSVATFDAAAQKSVSCCILPSPT